MKQLAYDNFDLQIEPIGKSRYRVQVLESPAGQAEHAFRAPFNKLQLENFYLHMGQARQGLRSAGRADALEIERTRDFGARLFTCLFGPGVYACYRSSLDEARERGKGLRIRLRLNAAELSALPWEFLYDPNVEMFLSRSIDTPIVRYMELPFKDPVLSVKPPLTMLVVIANPLHNLDVEREWGLLMRALAPLQTCGLVQIERLPGADLGSLQRRLRQGDVHIFHFIGHGDYSERDLGGGLLFENEAGQPVMLRGDQLGPVLHNHRALRLVVLNACEGARASPQDLFSGVAQQLVQMGIPAVVAMQFSVSDQSAITFAEQFYGALADGFPVDAALVEARTAISALPNDLEWGTPVYFTRAGDGRVFDIQPPPDPSHAADTVPRKERASEPPTAGAASGQGLRTAWARLSGAPPSTRVMGLGLLVAVLLGWLLYLAIFRAGPPPAATSLPAIQSPAASMTALALAAGQTAAADTAAAHTAQAAAAAAAPTHTPRPPTATASATHTSAPPTATPAPTATPTDTPAPGAAVTPLPLMVDIPAGVFLMGEDPRMAQSICMADSGLLGSAATIGRESPRHEVYIQAFQLDRYEVTTDQYAEFLNDLTASGSGVLAYIDMDRIREARILVARSGKWVAGPDYTGKPMVSVSWYGAEAYCRAQDARLPSEAEWERAARGVEGRVYAWGSDFMPGSANYCDSSCTESWAAAGFNDEVKFLAPVDAFPGGQTQEGIFNLTGNVWEWVGDWYAEYSQVTHSGPLRNPTGPARGSYRLVKGGAWNSTICDLRASVRQRFAPSYSSTAVGFRCAR